MSPINFRLTEGVSELITPSTRVAVFQDFKYIRGTGKSLPAEEFSAKQLDSPSLSLGPPVILPNRSFLLSVSAHPP